jgi:hypothetical protein
MKAKFHTGLHGVSKDSLSHVEKKNKTYLSDTMQPKQDILIKSWPNLIQGP